MISTRHLHDFRWYLWGPALLVAAGVLVPLSYLALRAFQGDAGELADLVLRPRNLRLLGNTLGLTAGVLLLTSAIAFPLAWLVARTDIKGKQIVTLLGVLPLAVPGYVMAYALMGATGPSGLLSGLHLPRPSGYIGAWVALGLYTFPYLFLNLRAALLGLDPSLEDAARSLGYSNREVARRVVLPQLRPAFLAGGLLIALHVLGDFGVVSLMRFETFSYAIYLQYAAAFDRVYAAWLALMLLSLTGVMLLLEMRLLRGRRYERTGSGLARKAGASPLGRWAAPAYGFIGLVGLAGVALPVSTVVYWLGRGAEHGRWSDLLRAFLDSCSAALPAAVLATALALPVAYLSVRKPSWPAHAAERIAYLGYATPPLAFALALIFFTLRSAPFLYQSLGLLIVAYALHFLAEAIGPIRSALYQAPARIQEAARNLGRSPLRAFFEGTFPLLRGSLGAGMAFVFLSALKELPITFLLSPLGFRSLAMGVWGAAGESLFSVAAPYALVLMVTSTALVGLLLRKA